MPLSGQCLSSRLKNSASNLSDVFFKSITAAFPATRAKPEKLPHSCRFVWRNAELLGFAGQAIFIIGKKSHYLYAFSSQFFISVFVIIVNLSKLLFR